jgi:O-antigen/teichoic acid export membrane protein
MPVKLEMIEKKIGQEKAEPLSQKVIKGGVWVFALRVLNRGLGFIRTIILARLLAPADFGLLGIAMLSISMLETFSQTGFQAALIQKKENINTYLDTAWTVSIIRGCVLFSILFFAAPFVAKFFNSPQAITVIRVVAISVLLSGLRNIGVVFFQKELEFNKQFYYEFSSTIVDLIVSISLALVLRNVWALIWGGIAANLIRLFMSYVLHTYRPKFTFNKQKTKELFQFGKWVFGSSILIFLVTQGDDIFVGKILGVTALGLYQMAYLISNLPASEITHVISYVAFPAYSKIQDDPQYLREAYLKILQLTAFLSFPLAGLILVLAPDFIRIVFGTKWLQMVAPVQILVIAGLVRSIAATAGPVLHATGNPRKDTFWQSVRFFILLISVYPLTIHWGLLGTSIAVLLSILIATFGFLAAVTSLTNIPVPLFEKALIIPFFTTALVILPIQILIITPNTLGNSILLLVPILFATTYCVFSFLADRTVNYGIYKLIRQLAHHS